MTHCHQFWNLAVQTRSLLVIHVHDSVTSCCPGCEWQPCRSHSCARLRFNTKWRFLNDTSSRNAQKTTANKHRFEQTGGFYGCIAGFTVIKKKKSIQKSVKNKWVHVRCGWVAPSTISTCKSRQHSTMQTNAQQQAAMHPRHTTQHNPPAANQERKIQGICKGVSWKTLHPDRLGKT